MHQDDPASKLKGLAWIAIALFVGAGFARGLSRLAGLVPWSTEKKLATMLGDFSNLRACSNVEGAAALQALVRRLDPVYPEDSTFPLKVTVVRGSTINAFAGLGGQIYVYAGLVQQAESADELAGVLAHEIEHVRRRHIIEGVIVRLSAMQTFSLILGDGGTANPAIVSALFNMQFSQGQEREADEGGLRRLSDVQIDNAGFKHFFQRLREMPLMSALLSDHPSNGDRVALIARYHASRPTAALGAEEWKRLRSICD